MIDTVGGNVGYSDRSDPPVLDTGIMCLAMPTSTMCTYLLVLLHGYFHTNTILDNMPVEFGVDLFGITLTASSLVRLYFTHRD